MASIDGTSLDLPQPPARVSPSVRPTDSSAAPGRQRKRSPLDDDIDDEDEDDAPIRQPLKRRRTSSVVNSEEEEEEEEEPEPEEEPMVQPARKNQVPASAIVIAHAQPKKPSTRSAGKTKH